MEAENLKKYIESMELPDSAMAGAERKSFVRSASSGVINKGCLAAFDQSVSGQLRQDMLFSMLLSQMVADKLHDRSTSPDQWRVLFLDTLLKIGWTVLGETFSEFAEGDRTFRMDKASIDFIEDGGAAEGAVQSLKRGADALRQHWGSRAGELFTSSCTYRNSGNFQLMAVASDGAVVLGNFIFQGQESHPDFFTAEWNSRNTKLSRYRFEMRLDDSIYDRIRELVVRKLEDRINSDIADI